MFPFFSFDSRQNLKAKRSGRVTSGPPYSLTLYSSGNRRPVALEVVAAEALY